MSRHRSWQYATGPRTPEVDALWDALFMDNCPRHAPGITCCHLQGGGSSPEEVTVWLWANKTKAARVAARLDEHFGQRGTVTELR